MKIIKKIEDKNAKKFAGILIGIGIIMVLFIGSSKINAIQKETQSFENLKKISQTRVGTIQEIEQRKKEEIQKVTKQAYRNMPKEQKGYPVIGKLEIPNIELTTYILGETTKESLDISVTKIFGPSINEIGNFCITGHNYRKSNMFGNLKKLEKGDFILLTDPFEQTVQYEVYDIQKVSPKEVECLNQNTNQEREVTLITCTTGALKRLVIKAVEVYD